MFTMRPAVGPDQAEIAAMIKSRAAWMRERGLLGADGWHEKAESLAAQAGDPDVPVWVCADAANRIAGITSLYDETPQWGWTEAERVQPAIFLATTVTRPDLAGQRLGCLIAWWALDHAARTGHEHVRRGCGYTQLMRYYRDIQGWELAHEVERHGVTAYLLSRPAQRRTDLTGRISSTED
jgi:hypothetical protein